jgi:hypothetical protein
MATLDRLCDLLVRKTCRCLAGRHWFELIAAASHAHRLLRTTACCAVAAVHDLINTTEALPTPAHVLKILCANYVKHEMRNFFVRMRRDRSRSPPRLCERLCPRETSPVAEDASDAEEVAPASQEEVPDIEPVPDIEDRNPAQATEEVSESKIPTDDFIPLEAAKHPEPSNNPIARGGQILEIMSRVIMFFSADDPDDASGWVECAERYPELQDMVNAFRQWRRTREALRASSDEDPVRQFEVAVAALVSFVDCSVHEDEDEEDEEDEEDDEDDEEGFDLCCDTSSDDEETLELQETCERDPCYRFLIALGANVSPVNYKHLTRFRTAFADQEDPSSLHEVLTSMLQNLDCSCLDEESMLHAWVDAAAHALVHIGSDKCDVIVASRGFFTLERRWPSVEELQEYGSRQRMQSGDPDRFYREERFAVPTPNLHRLVPSVAATDSDCAICGHVVAAGGPCYLLSCGHQFHAEDCLEGETIVNWLSGNRRCPVCRLEVAL